MLVDDDDKQLLVVQNCSKRTASRRLLWKSLSLMCMLTHHMQHWSFSSQLLQELARRCRRSRCDGFETNDFDLLNRKSDLDGVDMIKGKWYRGVTTRDHRDGSYDVAYDNYLTEERVPHHCISLFLWWWWCCCWYVISGEYKKRNFDDDDGLLTGFLKIIIWSLPLLLFGIHL